MKKYFYNILKYAMPFFLFIGMAALIYHATHPIEEENAAEVAVNIPAAILLMIIASTVMAMLFSGLMAAMTVYIEKKEGK